MSSSMSTPQGVPRCSPTKRCGSPMQPSSSQGESERNSLSLRGEAPTRSATFSALLRSTGSVRPMRYLRPKVRPFGRPKQAWKPSSAGSRASGSCSSLAVTPHPRGHRGISDSLGTADPRYTGHADPPTSGARLNELWHIDIKGPVLPATSTARASARSRSSGLVDDHSRFIIGLRILPSPSTAPILDWLSECFELCGLPLEVMSDNGAPFVVWMPGVLTLFGKTLAYLRVGTSEPRSTHPGPTARSSVSGVCCSPSCSTANCSSPPRPVPSRTHAFRGHYKGVTVIATIPDVDRLAL